MEDAAEDDDDARLYSSQFVIGTCSAFGVEAQEDEHTWIMNIMMGSLGSYLDGFSPWRIPPWPGALTAMAIAEFASDAAQLL